MMDKKDIKERKYDLEEGIEELLKIFSEHSNIRVDAISLTNASALALSKGEYFVNVKLVKD